MKIRSLLVLTCMSLLLFACKDNGETNQKKHGVDKDYILFTSDGGEEVVACLNREKWWIDSFEELVRINNEWQIVNSYDPEEWMFEYADDWLQLDGDWYSVSVPETTGCAKLLIRVSPNETGNARKLLVGMESGNWFPTITIEQQ